MQLQVHDSELQMNPRQQKLQRHLKTKLRFGEFPPRVPAFCLMHCCANAVQKLQASDLLIAEAAEQKQPVENGKSFFLWGLQ